MSQQEIDIKLLKKLCQNEDNIVITQHTLTRCIQRNITVDEILQTIENGEIVLCSKILFQYYIEIPLPMRLGGFFAILKIH